MQVDQTGLIISLVLYGGGSLTATAQGSSRDPADVVEKHLHSRTMAATHQ